MKKLLLVCIISSFYSVSQSSAQQSWYKRLAGKIDRYAVTLHLHKAGRRFSGYYYYDSQQQPIRFIGEDTTQKGMVTLVCFTNAESPETFRFSLSGDSVKGTWQQDERSKTLSFSAVETKAPVLFTYVYTEGAAALRPKLKESPQATYEAASVWPVGTSITDNYLKNSIRQSFSENNTGNEEIGSLLLREKKTYLQEYLQEHKTATEKELKEAPPVYMAAISNQLTIAHQSPKLLTLAFLNYAYTGGAHGNYGTTYTSIDLMNRKKLKLANIINERGIKALSGLLEKNFKTTHGLQQTDSLQKGGLFENSLKPNANFYVTPRGIGFNYVPYEIGPYVMGEIEIFIPMNELEPYLQSNFRQLLQ